MFWRLPGGFRLVARSIENQIGLNRSFNVREVRVATSPVQSSWFKAGTPGSGIITLPNPMSMILLLILEELPVRTSPIGQAQHACRLELMKSLYVKMILPWLLSCLFVIISDPPDAAA